MAISFSCPECGKKLKAPDNAAGKPSKCPGCGTPVTCPGPIFDAELLAVIPDGPEAASQPGERQAYAVVPEAIELPAEDVRRPCPMCGEMIVATAAKCRFCGEIFDDTLGKGGPGSKKGKLKQIASAHKNLQICVLLIIACWIGIFGMSAAVGKNADPAMILIRIILLAANAGAVIGLVVYAVILGLKLYNTWVAILLGLLMLVPCVNLLVALFVSQRASQLLKDNGYEVGLLGAKTI